MAPDDAGKVTRIIAASAVMGRRFHAGMVSSPMGDILKPASGHDYCGSDSISVSGRPQLDVIARLTSSPCQLQATLPGLSAVLIVGLAPRHAVQNQRHRLRDRSPSGNRAQDVVEGATAYRPAHA
ncbi:hypothetical protein [uncultured Paraburkholderia sp.]|uniref:hypothetical protein n=1 Tax=uncultured Paraburkholderia sp. TaxID=1822466 RepID=UPI002592D843|nr:hypothetical protein [uncultured Paraburkholderia sp.]